MEISDDLKCTRLRILRLTHIPLIVTGCAFFDVKLHHRRCAMELATRMLGWLPLHGRIFRHFVGAMARLSYYLYTITMAWDVGLTFFFHQINFSVAVVALFKCPFRCGGLPDIFSTTVQLVVTHAFIQKQGAPICWLFSLQ